MNPLNNSNVISNYIEVKYCSDQNERSGWDNIDLWIDLFWPTLGVRRESWVDKFIVDLGIAGKVIEINNELASLLAHRIMTKLVLTLPDTTTFTEFYGTRPLSTLTVDGSLVTTHGVMSREMVVTMFSSSVNKQIYDLIPRVAIPPQLMISIESIIRLVMLGDYIRVSAFLDKIHYGHLPVYGDIEELVAKIEPLLFDHIRNCVSYIGALHDDNKDHELNRYLFEWLVYVAYGGARQIVGWDDVERVLKLTIPTIKDGEEYVAYSDVFVQYFKRRKSKPEVVYCNHTYHSHRVFHVINGMPSVVGMSTLKSLRFLYLANLSMTYGVLHPNNSDYTDTTHPLDVLEEFGGIPNDYYPVLDPSAWKERMGKLTEKKLPDITELLRRIN